jgi:lysophospholipase L1-like esterase
LVFIDYHAVLADPQGAMRAGLSLDGVHPNRDGYAAMRVLAERVR